MMFEDIITAKSGRKFKLSVSKSAAENEFGMNVIEYYVLDVGMHADWPHPLHRHYIPHINYPMQEIFKAGTSGAVLQTKHITTTGDTSSGCRRMILIGNKGWIHLESPF